MKPIVDAFHASWCQHDFGDLMPVTQQTVFYVDKGEMLININGASQEQQAGHGDIIWLPRNTLRTWHTSGSVSMYVIRADVELPAHYPTLLLPGVIPAASPAHAAYLCGRIVDMFIRDDPREHLEQLGVFIELLGLLEKSRSLASFTPSKIRILTQVLEYMAAEYRNPHLGIKDFLNQTGWTRGYFMRVFREFAGEPPMTYLRRLRINAAQSLLRSGDWTVSEVAYHVGFSDPAYFSRIFTRYIGQPPSKVLERW